MSFRWQALTGQLEEKEKELSSEKKNTLKRDKTIQGLTLVLREKEKEVGSQGTCEMAAIFQPQEKKLQHCDIISMMSRWKCEYILPNVDGYG